MVWLIQKMGAMILVTGESLIWLLSRAREAVGIETDKTKDTKLTTDRESTRVKTETEWL